MDPAVAAWLVSPAADDALDAAAAEPDPGSLGAAERLRRLVSAERAAAVAEQAVLRRRAVAKFGDAAATTFFTSTGLEQATRRVVADPRAARFADAGVRHVVDLGCGIGADALAFQRAGLRVTPVERDPATAVLAGATLGVDVVVADAESAWPSLAASDPDAGVFCDPARRTSSGRSWRVEDLSPPWSFAESLLDGSRLACVKLGPGVPTSLIPDAVEAEWVSDAGSVVEATLWAGPGTVAGRRRAVVDGVVLERDSTPDAVVPAGLDDWLYEPDGAVIRAGLGGHLARLLGAAPVHADVAYLAGPAYVPTPFATAFEVLEVLPYDLKALRAWVREHGAGTLEIKKRGIDVDPATLRRQLKPRGAASATLLLTPTPEGVRALVVRRHA